MPEIVTVQKPLDHWLVEEEDSEGHSIVTRSEPDSRPLLAPLPCSAPQVSLSVILLLLVGLWALQSVQVSSWTRREW